MRHFFFLLFVLPQFVQAQDLPTIREVFDFEVGDEYHFKATNIPPNARRYTILEKYFSENEDTLTYVRSFNNYGSIALGTDPWLEYNFYSGVDTLSYYNLDSTIYYYNPIANHFNEDTLYYPNDVCDSTLVGYEYEYDPGLESYAIYGTRFGKGLGIAKRTYSALGFSNESLLVFFNKQGVTCGEPDVLSVSSIKTNLLFEVFPNPFVSFINVKPKGGVQHLNIEILDVSGNTVLTFEKSNSESINLEWLPAGLYILHVSDGKSVERTKIIKL